SSSSGSFSSLGSGTGRGVAPLPVERVDCVRSAFRSVLVGLRRGIRPVLDCRCFGPLGLVLGCLGCGLTRLGRLRLVLRLLVGLLLVGGVVLGLRFDRVALAVSGAVASVGGVGDDFAGAPVGSDLVGRFTDVGQVDVVSSGDGDGGFVGG